MAKEEEVLSKNQHDALIVAFEECKHMDGLQKVHQFIEVMEDGPSKDYLIATFEELVRIKMSVIIYRDGFAEKDEHTSSCLEWNLPQKIS